MENLGTQRMGLSTSIGGKEKQCLEFGGFVFESFEYDYDSLAFSSLDVYQS